ncbi:Anti-sigma-K factor rskA [Nakamurella panacisegetis]|uniref:Regulator of SigK n=1 Tax=Nakamurella panacisegetis TaxID=1090615 RepID=A0A1H0JRC0_9ACTN|nr:anti-sigma factor [Nakamurella panacisegetis]SDO46276.1 Anti-sigma-K factor rskA [Nakamurella panacisegetis]
MTTDQHLNTGAMALGALPDDEAAEYADHLRTCPTCVDELASFLQTAAILGSSVAQAPPAGLRRSVMAAVAQTPQLPPLTEDSAGRHRHTAESAPAPTTAVGIPEPDGGSATVIPLRRPWYRRPQALLAAAAAVLVVGGGTTLALSGRSQPPSAIACVAAAADKTVEKPTVGASAGGTVTIAGSCNAAVVQMPPMADPPSGKVYQMWVIKGATPTSAGIVTKQADGTYGKVGMPVHVGDTAVAVTVEPDGGSAKPTTSPLWVVPLTA